jgi:hypothetical protein
MDYHILDICTLKSMSKDIDREIKRMQRRLRQLQEQKEIIEIIILHRGERQNDIKSSDDDITIHPLK